MNSLSSRVAEATFTGTFVSFEGVDGCGKSTQLSYVIAALAEVGLTPVQLREPGGTAISEKIRDLLLDPANKGMAAECELLLYEASRAQLVREVIAPALAEGQLIICDRFYDSTYAYQCAARGLSEASVISANALGSCGYAPTLTIVLDLDPERAFARATREGADRLEAEGVQFQQRVRAGYRRLASLEPDRVRSFEAKWKASVPGIEPVEFTSVPGCFCHRRLDEGGLALAEVVSRELRERGGDGGRLLDMGCGCGLVGFLVAKAVPGVSLVMVDSHSRAVEAANMNAANIGVPAEVILSDKGTPARMDGTFDVFVGNPPYYSDYRIADVFLETARRALKPGGVCYTVCKNAAGLEPVQRRYFPDVKIVKRRGYAVLKSVKEDVQ